MAQERTARWLMACGAVGPPLFVLVFLVTGALRSGYDPTYHPVSALSLGGLGWIQILNFVVTGLLLIGFAAGLRRGLRPGPGSGSGPALVGVLGLALVASGVFVMDAMRGFPPGTPADAEAAGSWHHTLHSIAGLVVFGSASVAGLVLTRWFAARRRPGWAVYSLATGTVGLLLFVAFGVALEADYAYTGVLQRVLIIGLWTWLTLVALRLWADQRQVSPTRPSTTVA